MFERLTDELLDLTVTERAHAVGNALPAFPLCCSIVLCIELCSSSSSREDLV
jgi:hypothetical protein